MSENTTTTNNLYIKIQTAKKLLSEKNLKKSGKNSYSNFDYFELSDFLPSIIEIFADIGLFSKVTFTDETATLKIVNAENPAETEEYTSPMRTLELKGANAIQSLGGIQTYQRRYLYMAALDITESDMFDSTSGEKDDKLDESKSGKSNADYLKESHQREKEYAKSTGINPNENISEAQAKLLFAKSDKETVRKVINEFGYENTTAILKKDFDAILKKVVDEKIKNEKTEDKIA